MSKSSYQALQSFELADPRAMAVRTLERVSAGAYSNLQLDAMVKRSHLTERDVHFMTTLVYGVIQHRLTLEYWLKYFVKDLKRIDPWVKEVLLVALYQWQFLDKVPQHAIFDQAIELAKRRGHVGIRKFVTGILHAMDRQGLPSLTAISEPTERLALSYSLPQWLMQRLIDDYGLIRAEGIAASLNQAPAQSVRVNTAEVTVEQARDDLEQAGFTVTPSDISPVALKLTGGGHISETVAFQTGQMTIQDEAATLMVPSLQIEPHMRVLDAAAAPGGKTTQMATYLDAQAGGIVEALDIHPHKVKLIQDNARRLHVADRIHAQALDARKVDQAFADASFDRILVDAPCSGLGLLRRKPEVRYEKQLSDSYALQKIQLAILEAVAPKLKVGGRLVYGTCTLLKIENDDVIAAFIAQHPEYRLVPTHLEKELPVQDDQGLVHILPDQYQTDGFFIATLERIK